MEDWKAVAQNRNQDDIFFPSDEKKLSGQENNKTKSLEDQEENFPEGPKRTSLIPAPKLSIISLDGSDKDEQDCALRNAKEKAHTLIEKDCAAEEVILVWEEISKFIIIKMMEGQAVRIAGLGTFIYRITKTPVNQRSVKVTKVPVFLISEKLALMYRLNQDKPFISNAPTVPLNLSAIAFETRLPRGIIEGIITEILQAFARAIVCNKSLELPFPCIGKLQIRDQKVSFKFYEEFCSKVGFNVAKTKSQMNIMDDNISGNMTPLKLHIPTETFRSVFHLREVRSIHEDSLLVPLKKVDGKYIPVTIACGDIAAKEQMPEIDENLTNLTKSTDSKQVIFSLEESLCSAREYEKNCFDVEMEKLKFRQFRMSKLKNPWINPQPLWEAQKTGDCVLDAMNKCPKVMLQCLKAHMYRLFVDKLGKDMVKSHFHRRSNQGPTREFSFSHIWNEISDDESSGDGTAKSS